VSRSGLGLQRRRTETENKGDMKSVSRLIRIGKRMRTNPSPSEERKKKAKVERKEREKFSSIFP